MYPYEFLFPTKSLNLPRMPIAVPYYFSIVNGWFVDFLSCASTRMAPWAKLSFVFSKLIALFDVFIRKGDFLISS